MRKTLTVSALALALATLGTASGEARPQGPASLAEVGPVQVAHGYGDREGGRHADRHGGGAMRLLRTFDLDGDGAVTQAEIDGFRQDQMTRFDADRNGTLSLDEYQALWLDAMRERMVDAFQAHDDDGNGQVTAQEFNERFAGLVERLDRNGDARLSRDDRRGDGRAERRGGSPQPDADTAPGAAPGAAPAPGQAPRP